jgi:chorismate dehydratase
VGGLAELQGVTAFLGCYGIAVEKEVMSVLFFSDRPFEQLDHRHTLSLSGESASSVRLLYLLMGYQLGFDALPAVVAKGNPSNGCLVIGDRALLWAKEMETTGSVGGYSHVIDLGKVWHGRFQLPFVFARWVIRKDTPSEVVSALTDWLKRFEGEEVHCIRRAAPKMADRLGLPLAYAKKYLNIIKRCLSKDFEVGQDRFLKEIGHYGATALFPPGIGEMPPSAPQDER